MESHFVSCRAVNVSLWKDQKGQRAAVPGFRELYTWREL